MTKRNLNARPKPEKLFIGQRFGITTIIGGPARKFGKAGYWECLCDCGSKRTSSSDNLRKGKSNSCGCVGHEQTRLRMTKHGAAPAGNPTKEYRSWASAKGRCFNETDSNYPNYGGRGITMCKDWAESFEAFLAYMGPCPNGKTIDRKNNDGNYEPGNCRWATAEEQRSNTRWNVYLFHDGVRYSFAEFCRLKDVSYKSLHHFYRMKKLPLETALVRARKGYCGVN